MHGMSTKRIELELAEMKKRLEKLEAKAVSQPRQDWHAGVGALKGCTFHREAARLGAEYRAKENRRK